MWLSRTKNDLIIEVWEKLDCENIGAAEIEAIEAVVADKYGRSAAGSPMVIARLLADEGAELRHSEIMGLYVERASNRPYDAALRNILNFEDLKRTAASIRDLENLRRKYKSQNDKEGLRRIREAALRGKQNAVAEIKKKNADTAVKELNEEIANWLRIWLETPEIFDGWLTLRQKAPDFANRFGDFNDF